MADRYADLIRRALDDSNGDRGDVAPPAINMPRSMGSRCMACGRDLSVKQAAAGDVCQEHSEELAGNKAMDTADPHTVQRPGGSVTKPISPMTKNNADGEDGEALDDVAMGGPGSGPQGGKSPAQEAWAKAGAQGKHGLRRVAAVVKDAVKTIGHGIITQNQPDFPEDK